MSNELRLDMLTKLFAFVVYAVCASVRSGI